MQAINPNSQKERAAEQLMLLSGDVTETDRVEFCNEFDFGSSTVSSYLNGKVYNLDTAVTMLAFFRKKIAAREKLLKA